MQQTSAGALQYFQNPVRVSLLLTTAAVAWLAALPVAAAEEDGELEHPLEGQHALHQAISVMLLGSVTFVMGLFYLVHHKDEDIKKYTWQVISATISIFCAVLLFQSVSGIAQVYFLDGASEHKALQFNLIQMLLWFCVLQVLLAWVSGSLGRPPKTKADINTMKLRLKTWAVLLGHITGFSAINAFGQLQQLVPRTFVYIFAIWPLTWVSVFVLTRITDFIREHEAAEDGVKTECEKAWDEMTEETEDDVVGLGVSFVYVQMLRYSISGTLPNVEGNEPEPLLVNHSAKEACMLVAGGIVTLCVNFAGKHMAKGRKSRKKNQMGNIAAMVLAWCVYFSTDWFISGKLQHLHGMLKQIVLAMYVTGISLVLIYGLDALADLECTKDEVDKMVRDVVQSLGILIGFSWEKSFDEAVDQAVEAVDAIGVTTLKGVPDYIIKLILAIMLCTIVVPAWRHHILPTIMKYEEPEEREEEREGDEASEGSEHGGETEEMSDITLQPGQLGLTWMPSTGKIQRALPDGQAERAGVMPGWRISKVDGQPYSVEVMDSKIEGVSAYTVSFVKEPPSSPGSGGSPQKASPTKHVNWSPSDGSTLAEPLLLNKAQRRVSNGASNGTSTRSQATRGAGSTNGVARSASATKSAEYKQRIAVLERRNRDLEATLPEIVAEIGELQAELGALRAEMG